MLATDSQVARALAIWYCQAPVVPNLALKVAFRTLMPLSHETPSGAML